MEATTLNPKGKSSNAPVSDFVSPRAGWCWLAAILFLALPVAKWWQLTRDGNAVVAWIALSLAFAWWIGRTVVEVRPQTTPGAAMVGLGVLFVHVWLLAWLRVEDFWVLRWGFFVLGVALSLVLWGWVGPVRALRPLIALLLWALQPPGRLQYVESPSWLCEVTASVAGFCLWQYYSSAVIQGATIFLPHGAVSVGGGCTGLTLLIALAYLFVPAWLIFRLSWRRALLVALGVTAVAFVLSVVRVMLMAVVVANRERFDYWHGPNGASWFTALGMLAMAWMIDRALARPAQDSRDERVTLARGQALMLGGLAAVAGVVALAAAFWPPRQTAPITGRTPAFKGYTLIAEADEALPRANDPGVFPFTRQRTVRYEAPLQAAKLSVRFCVAPCLLDGDPIGAAWNYGWFDRRQGLSAWHEVDVGGLELRQEISPGQRVWMATLPGDAPPVTDGAEWARVGAARLWRARTWLRWLAGLAPLRDKRACWIELVWTGAGDPPMTEVRAALAEWSALAAENLKTLRR